MPFEVVDELHCGVQKYDTDDVQYSIVPFGAWWDYRLVKQSQRTF